MNSKKYVRKEFCGTVFYCEAQDFLFVSAGYHTKDVLSIRKFFQIRT